MQVLVSYYGDDSTELFHQFIVKVESIEAARAAVEKYFAHVGGRPDGVGEFFEAPRGGVPENPSLIHIDESGVVLSVGFDFLD